MEILYNFWGAELQMLISKSNTNRRNYLPLTIDQQDATNQQLNNARLYTELIKTWIPASGGDIWKEYLQPLWLDYLTRCKAAAPEGATGQYLVSCSNAWRDSTINYLTRTLDYFKAQHNTPACVLIQLAIDFCEIETLRYYVDLSQYDCTPINTLSSNLPAPEDTAQNVADARRAKVLEIIRFNSLQICYQRLFKIGVFSTDTSGAWIWKGSRWELALFIYLVDRIVNYEDKRLSIDDDIYKPINWTYFEDWIIYKGKPLKSNQIRSSVNDVSRI